MRPTALGRERRVKLNDYYNKRQEDWNKLEMGRAVDRRSATTEVRLHVTQVPAEPKVFHLVAGPPRAEVALDASMPDGTVPPELAALQEEQEEPSPVAVDRVAIATAAMAHLDFAQALAVFSDWQRDLSPDQQETVAAALGGLLHRACRARRPRPSSFDRASRRPSASISVAATGRTKNGKPAR